MHARGRGGVSATFAARLGLLPPPAGAQRPAERPADAPVEVPAEPAPRPPKPSSARDVYVLWTHDERFSKEAGRNGTRQPRLALISQHLWNLQDVLINPQVFPGIRANDVVEIFLARPSLLPSASHSRSHSLMGEALFAIPEEVKALEPLATPKRLVLQATLVDKDVLSKQPQLQVSPGDC